MRATRPPAAASSETPLRRSAAERQLVVEAIASFKRRARLVAEQFERPDYRLVELQVSTGSEPIRMRSVRAAAMSAEAAVAAAVIATAIPKVEGSSTMGTR